MAGILSGLIFSSCTVPGNGYSILDREAQASDKVPETLPDYAGDDADLSSSRFVGEHDGTSLWLMKGNDAEAVCLLAYPDAEGWVIGCSGIASQSRLGGAGAGFLFQPDFAPEPEGSIKISANVYVTERA